MKMKLKGLVALLVLVAGAGVAQAQQKSVTIHPSIPPVTSAKDAPFPGWYELEAGGKRFYLSADGRYMMLGQVVDLGVSAAAAAQGGSAGKVDVSKLASASTNIKFVNGTGKRVMYVFSDPDCPYCKQLEADMAKFKDTKVVLIPYPLESLHPQAKAKAAAILCQDDKAQAWRKSLLSGATYAGGERCMAKVEKNIELGRSLGINATPTIFNADGERAIGYVPFETLNSFIK